MVAGVHEEGSLEFRPGGLRDANLGNNRARPAGFYGGFLPRRAPQRPRAARDGSGVTGRLRHIFQLLERQNLHGGAGRLGLHVHRLTGPERILPHEGGAEPHPATAPRGRRACRIRRADIGGGRARLRGVGPDGPPGRGGREPRPPSPQRWPRSPGPRGRKFLHLPVRFSPARRHRTCRKPEYGFFALSGGVQPGRRSAIWPAYQFRHIGLSVRRGQSQTTATRRDADSP